MNRKETREQKCLRFLKDAIKVRRAAAQERVKSAKSFSRRCGDNTHDKLIATGTLHAESTAFEYLDELQKIIEYHGM